MKVEVNEMLLDEISDLQGVLDQVGQTMTQGFSEAVELVSSALQGGGKLLLAGNGGSAAEAQHMAAEYVATLNKANMRKGFPALSLSTDTSFLTAWSNDFGYANVFARQIQVLGAEGDVFIAYSTSGNSQSILNALAEAKALGLRTLGFAGNGGGKMAALCDVCLTVPSNKTQRIQEVHTLLGHTLCGVVERRLATFGSL